MRGRDIDGSYLTEEWRRLASQDRRREMRDLGLCINGPRASGVVGRSGAKHGKPNPTSGKCDRCEAVARLSR